MPSVALTVLNFFQGNSGIAYGTNIFTDLTGPFTPNIQGSVLNVGGQSFPVLQFLSSTSIKVDGTVPSGSSLGWTVSLPVTDNQLLTVTESPTLGYLLSMQATAVETSSALASKRVQLAFDYGASIQPPQPVVDDGMAQQQYAYRYTPGSYRITATATNFRYPIPQIASVRLNLVVNGILPVANSAQFSIIGPIIPEDTGYPDAEEWNLNIGQDDRLLASNLKMLINTPVGSRLMDPNYGTAISTSIFDMDQNAIQDFLQTQIGTAITTYEPRCKLTGIDYAFSSTSRSATLVVTVQSLITRSFVPVSITING